MKTIFSLSICLLSCLLAGCATKSTYANLTIYSVPAGANLTDSITGEDYGVAPKSIYYNTSDIVPDSEGCFYLNGFEASWVSGAAERTEQLKFCGSTTGNYQLAVGRTDSYPGIEQDMERASQIQQEQAQARALAQARAERIARNRRIDRFNNIEPLGGVPNNGTPAGLNNVSLPP